jgi:Arc/MetJ family transcription regulator
MRINFPVDRKLMNAAMRATGLSKQREVIELGLRMLLRIRQQDEIRRLRGQRNWKGDLEAMRVDK